MGASCGSAYCPAVCCADGTAEQVAPAGSEWSASNEQVPSDVKVVESKENMSSAYAGLSSQSDGVTTAADILEGEVFTKESKLFTIPELTHEFGDEESWPLPVARSSEDVTEFRPASLSPRGDPRSATLNSLASNTSTSSQSKGLSKFKAAVHTVQMTNASPTMLCQGKSGEFKHQKPSGNGNHPGDYSWLQQLLEKISKNDANSIGCKGADGKATCPMFFLMGACPNALCGMQAVMFSSTAERSVDFWWVKPRKDNKKVLEEQTLVRQSSGPHKNDPGRSGPLMQPLADIFQKGESTNGWLFGIDVVEENGMKVPRAFLTQEGNKHGDHFYVILMWQEEWTTNPFSRSKYIKGKLVYQKRPKALKHWSRQYEIWDGVTYISDFEEPAPDAILPNDDIKALWDLGFPKH